MCVKPERAGRVILALGGGPVAGLGQGDGLALLLLVQFQPARLRILQQELWPALSGRLAVAESLLLVCQSECVSVRGDVASRDPVQWQRRHMLNSAHKVRRKNGRTVTLN